MINSTKNGKYRRLESNLVDISDEDEIELDDSPQYQTQQHVRTYKVTSLRRTRRMQRVLLSIFVIVVFLVLYIPLSQNLYRGRGGTIPGWSFNTSRDTRDYILPDDNTTILNVNVCAPIDNKKLFLLVVVCSSLNNFDQRQVHF